VSKQFFPKGNWPRKMAQKAGLHSAIHPSPSTLTWDTSISGLEDSSHCLVISLAIISDSTEKKDRTCRLFFSISGLSNEELDVFATCSKQYSFKQRHKVS
jgi:hypothetical protein